MFQSLGNLMSGQIKITMKSDIQECMENNQKRYLIKIPHFYKVKDHILYEAAIFDSAFFHSYTLYFRFKILKNLHEKLIKRVNPTEIPEFPRTNSFGFWNRTNYNLPLIRERIRQLEYYFTKLLNNSKLSNLNEIRQLHKAFQKTTVGRHRSESCHISKAIKVPFCKECPQFYHRQLKSAEFA